jgi:hypothetical protein
MYALLPAELIRMGDVAHLGLGLGLGCGCIKGILFSERVLYELVVCGYCGVWCVVCGVWCVVCGCGVYKGNHLDEKHFSGKSMSGARV